MIPILGMGREMSFSLTQMLIYASVRFSFTQNTRLSAALASIISLRKQLIVLPILTDFCATPILMMHLDDSI